MEYLLPELVQDKMRKEGLSIREAGRQIGIAHTTVIRILNGETLDLKTLIDVCEWLGVSPSSILDSQILGRSYLSAKIAVVVERNPEFAKVFEEAMDRLAQGKIDLATVADFVAYAAYRLKIEEKTEVDE